MAPPTADETRAEREERDHLVRKSQKPFPDLSVAVPNLRRTAGLPIWALADRSGLDADLLRRVEANRSRLTPDQFLRVAETCGAGDRADTAHPPRRPDGRSPTSRRASTFFRQLAAEAEAHASANFFSERRAPGAGGAKTAPARLAEDATAREK